MRNVDKLAEMFPGTQWHKLGNKYVGQFGSQSVAFNRDYIKSLFKQAKRKNQTQKAMSRAITEMKAKEWNSNEAN